MARTRVDASEVPRRLRHPIFDARGEYYAIGVSREYGAAVLFRGVYIVVKTRGDGVVATYAALKGVEHLAADSGKALQYIAIELENEANRFESLAEELTEVLRRHERVCDVIGEGGEKLYSAPFGQHKSEYINGAGELVPEQPHLPNIPVHLGPHRWRMQPLAGSDAVLTSNEEET